MVKKEKNNLTDNITELTQITKWFEDAENLDLEVGIIKVKMAAKLIKESKTRLREIENEFIEIKKDMSDEASDEIN